MDDYISHIGYKGLGYDVDFEEVRETDKAVLVKDDYGKTCWLPKSAIDDQGGLTEYGEKLYLEKLGL